MCIDVIDNDPGAEVMQIRSVALERTSQVRSYTTPILIVLPRAMDGTANAVIIASAAARRAHPRLPIVRTPVYVPI
jgi:hypothetical protein